MFAKFFNSAKMSSTYKPVFLKALLDVGDLADESKAGRIVGRQWLQRSDGRSWISKSDGRLFVDLNFIAIRFAKHYWDMEYRFKLKQSPQPGDANILKAINDVRDPRQKPPTIKALAGPSMSGFRTRVIRDSIKPEVLVHLKTDMPSLYRKESTNRISLHPTIVEYANRNKALKPGLSYIMTRYLETINRGTPNIAKKLGYNPYHTNHPQLCRNAFTEMCEWQRSLCFYCKHKFEKLHVDHVIPFNFVFSTDLYNCVLACQHCNCKKSDTLLHRKLFNRVVKRNRHRSDYISRQKAAYSERSYLLLYDTCISEYNGNKAFFKTARMRSAATQSVRRAGPGTNK